MGSPSRLAELRNRCRYRLKADAVFAWATLEDGLLVGDGITRDIGLAGAFISASDCPPIGTKVELEVALYPGTGLKRPKVRVLIESTVVRVERSVACEGFAVMSHDLWFAISRGKRKALCVAGGRASASRT
jgi:hypothetical protein